MILKNCVFKSAACWIIAGLFPILALGGMPAQEAASGPSLSARPLVIPGQGPWTAPVPSPDGRWLAYTSGNHRGIHLLELETGTTIRLSDDPGAGYRFVWAPDSSGLAYRKRVGPSRLAIVFVHTDGLEESASPLLPSLSTPIFLGSELVFFRYDGGKPVEMRRGTNLRTGDSSIPATTPDGRLWLGDLKGLLSEQTGDPRVFYSPVLSPDGESFVVECLDGHLYLGSTDGKVLRDLGAGSYPSFVHDGREVLFERTADDGHQLTAGDLYLLDLETGVLTVLTRTPDAIERRPALAPDSRTIYIEESGRLFEGRLP